MQKSLVIQDLSVSVEKKPVVWNINLTVRQGEIHILMGPNGSGKSSLAMALMGHYQYCVYRGRATIGNQNILSLQTDKRAKAGLFLTFQNPIAISGVTLGQLIFSSYKQSLPDNRRININNLYLRMKKNAEILGLKEDMLERDINDGFSGGEKKKAEMLTLLSLKPKFIIFDEIDSGLDIDALEQVAKVIAFMIKKQAGIILITHNQRIFKYIKPNFVHILKEGKIVKSGSYKLIQEVEQKGYAKI